MSAAGFERVNVTHNQFRSERAVKSLSSTSTTSGNAEGVASANARQNFSTSGGVSTGGTGVSPVGLTSGTGVPPVTPGYVGASTASTPGKQTRGSPNPSGSGSFSGGSTPRPRRLPPAAAMTTFEPSLKPLPE